MEYDSTALDWSLGRTLTDAGVSAQFALRDIMRVMANNLMQLTFPTNAKEGKTAIDADLSKVFNQLDDPDVLGYFNERFGDGSATQAGKLKGKKRRATARQELPGVKFNWQGDQGRMKAWHESHRRAGKVRTRSNIVATVGPWKFSSGMYVPSTAFKRYQRTAHASVAKLKSGWAPAVEYLGRVTGGRMILPAFVRKQARQRGSIEDATTAKGDGYIVIENATPYARRMTDFILGRAERTTSAYSQKATKKQADDIARRFNERKLQGAA